MKKMIRFNFIDYCICFVVASVIIFFSFRYSNDIKQTFLSEIGVSDIRITVKTQPFHREYSDNFIVGQPVIDYDNGIKIGKLSDVTIYDSSSPDGQGGSYVYALLLIDSNIYKNENHYVIDEDKFLINRVTRFALPEIFFEGNIISMHSSLDSNDRIYR